MTPWSTAAIMSTRLCSLCLMSARLYELYRIVPGRSQRTNERDYNQNEIHAKRKVYNIGRHPNTRERGYSALIPPADHTRIRARVVRHCVSLATIPSYYARSLREISKPAAPRAPISQDMKSRRAINPYSELISTCTSPITITNNRPGGVLEAENLSPQGRCFGALMSYLRAGKKGNGPKRS